MSDQHSHHGDGNPEIRFETRDVRATAILKFAVYLFIATIAVLFLMQRLYVAFARFEASRQPPPPVMQTAEGRKPPLPRLQETPPLDLVALQRSEEAVLSSYGWVDPASGIVRIPIDEAMRLVAERGLPVRGAEPVAAPTPAPKTGGKHK
jgi:hypothetical protein